jgi:hypothetical protein
MRTILAVASALLITAAPARAEPKPITGKLAKGNFTVVAIADSGKARAVVAKGKRFKLVPPAKKVTLHLRGADGVYAGPVVIARKGQDRVIVGVKAGAKLGILKVLKGYAKPKRKLAKKFVDRSRTARAKKGVPVGAGAFGRVKSKAGSLSGPGRDHDADGIPGAFDIDDDGDLVLDNFERNPSAKLFPAPGAPAPVLRSPSEFHVFSNLKLDLERSLNANAAAVTDAQIDQALESTQTLAVQVASGEEVELDCGGLGYCSAGGTGRSLEGARPFPDDFDSDSDGFGLLSVGPTGDFQLLTGAKGSEIGTGDAYVERIRNGSRESELPGVLNYAFSTTPALVSWSAGAASGTISYPASPGAPGSTGSPIVVGGTGDAIVTLTFWRPQRRPIAGEASEWVDIGLLKYSADVPNGPSGGGGAPGPGPGGCPSSTYTTADPNLSVTADGLVDSAADQPANPANTLTFSVNLTRCLAAAGQAWTTGQRLQVDIQARSEFGDNAAQKINFVRG